MNYLGNYAEDATVDFKFNTNQSDGTPITLGGTPAISVYKANGTTESTAGVTLTVDFDSRTGMHHVRIDTSADAFYATANDYQVVITTGTVSGVSVVGVVVAEFSIENRNIKANVTQLNSDAAAAARLALSAKQIIPGTVDTATNTHTPTTTEFQADDITEATADHYNGRIVIFTSGALLGQATDITDYVAVGGIGQFTVTALTEAPANNDTFIIV